MPQTHTLEGWFWTKVKRNGFACLSYDLIIIQFSAAVLHHSNIQYVCHFFKNPEWCSHTRNFPLNVRLKFFAESNKRGFPSILARRQRHSHQQLVLPSLVQSVFWSPSFDGTLAIDSVLGEYNKCVSAGQNTDFVGGATTNLGDNNDNVFKTFQLWPQFRTLVLV